MEEQKTSEYAYETDDDTDKFKRSAALTYANSDGNPGLLLAMAMGMPEFEGM